MTKANVGRRGNGDGSICEVRTLANNDRVYRWSIWVNSPIRGHIRLKGTYTGRNMVDAKQAMWERKKEEENGHQRPSAPNMTLSQLLDEWMTDDRELSGVSSRTLQIQKDLIRLHIKPMLGKWLVTAFSGKQIGEFHRELIKTTSLGRSRNMIHNVLSQVFKYAKTQDYITSNPIIGVKVPMRQEKRQVAAASVAKAWTPTEAHQLEQAALKKASTATLAIAFGLRTGMRRGEIFGLRWKQVDLNQGCLSIQEALSTHGKLSRTLTLPKNAASRRKIKLGAAAIQILRRIEEQQRESGLPLPEFVFTTRKGEMQHPNNANRVLRRLLTAEKLPILPFHSLRHTFVSIAAHQGWSIKTISVYIGHANTVVTQTIYLHLWPEDQEAVEFDLTAPTEK